MNKFILIFDNIYNIRHIVKIYRTDTEQNTIHIKHMDGSLTSIRLMDEDAADKVMIELENKLKVIVVDL